MDAELEILILKAKYLELRYGKEHETHLHENCSRCRMECRYNENHDRLGRFACAPDRGGGIGGSPSKSSGASVSDSSSVKSVQSDLQKQTIQQLNKSIKSLQRQIEHHKEKIANPEKYSSDWEDCPVRKREGRLRHWQHEIDTAEVSIARCRNEIKSRGDKNEE